MAAANSPCACPPGLRPNQPVNENERNLRVTATRDAAKARILVVEDDPHILLGLEEILKSEGYEVSVCSRGDRAMDALAKARPSLLVLDVMLPGLSGYDL